MKLVLIEWLDSHSGKGWQTIDQLERVAEPLYCRSVGWLLSERNGCKVLVPHLAGEKNRKAILLGCGDLTIPTKAVVKMMVLKQF